VGLDEAARRVVALAERLRAAGRSGVGVTEAHAGAPLPEAR
jgi:hypothetical protein